MGFGLLLIGYIMTMLNVPMLGTLGSVIRIGGCAVMICGALKLRRYCKAFELSLVGAILMTVMSSILLFINIDGFLYDNLLTNSKLISDFGKTVVGYIEQGITFIFNSFILWGIFKIAKETEVKKIVVGAVRNYIFVCAYHVVYLTSFLPFSGIQASRSEFALFAWILYFVWIGLNVWLLFSCYIQICDEDDVDMEHSSINIPVVNRLMDAFESKAKKAKEEDALYRQERRRKREEKKRRK